MLVDEPWRPPVPNEAPTLPDTFSVKVKAPDYGWIEFEVGVNEHVAKFAPSYCFFRLETLKHWLEAIARGDNPCIDMDAEGWSIYMMVNSTEVDGTVRFNVLFKYYDVPADKPTMSTWSMPTGGGETYDVILEQMCNVALTRSTLVETFYKALLDIWEKPDEEEFWFQWFLHAREWEECEWDDEIDAQPWYFSIKSPLIDRYLRASLAAEP